MDINRPDYRIDSERRRLEGHVRSVACIGSTARYILNELPSRCMIKVADFDMWSCHPKLFANAVLCGITGRDYQYNEVYDEKLRLGEKEITDRDLNVFFSDKALQSDVVAGWTDTAVRKLKQCFARMMFEAGLLESSVKPRTIKPIHIDYRTEELLIANGLGEYLKAVKGA